MVRPRWADIKYKLAQADGIVRRRVNYISGDPKNPERIESIEEFRLDARGNEVPVTRNEFQYTPGPAPNLAKIVRTAPVFQVWKPVSVITFPVVKPKAQNRQAVIALPNGKKKKTVTYRTLEDLLNQARKFDRVRS